LGLPFLMAPSCGTPPPMDCSTSELDLGAHAFEPDGTLAVFSADHDGVIWRRYAPPWTDPPSAVLTISRPSYPRYLPRIVAAPGGGRLLARGPVGTIDDALADVDANGPQVVPIGAANGDHIDFAATFDGDTPYVLVGRYGLDASVTLAFLRGPAT